jgi:transcriptional regulator with XRE-family HTH domain
VSNRFSPVDGARLRRLRQEQVLSLRELGEMTGIAFDTINKLELGTLGVEPKELMKGD